MLWLWWHMTLTKSQGQRSRSCPRYWTFLFFHVFKLYWPKGVQLWLVKHMTLKKCQGQRSRSCAKYLFWLSNMLFWLFGRLEVIFRLFVKMTLKIFFKVKGQKHVPNIDFWCFKCLFGLSDLFLRSFPFLRKDLIVFLLIIIIIVFFFFRQTLS